MVVLFRILLLLVPVFALILWIRWRAKKNSAEDVSNEDVRNMRLGLIGLIIMVLMAGIGIRMTDTSAGRDGRYVPARVENGKVIPGHFEKVDPDEEQSKDRNKDAEEGKDPRDENPG